MQIDPYLLSYTKLKSKRINDLDIRPDLLNLIGKEAGNNLESTGTKSNFLNRTLR